MSDNVQYARFTIAPETSVGVVAKTGIPVPCILQLWDFTGGAILWLVNSTTDTNEYVEANDDSAYFYTLKSELFLYNSSTTLTETVTVVAYPLPDNSGPTSATFNY